MSLRFESTWVLVLILTMVLARSSYAGHKGTDSDSSVKSDNNKIKKAFDSRALPALREQLQLADAEWDALLPRIQKVQVLAKELYDLRNPQKAIEPAKIFKLPRDSGSGANANGMNVTAATPSYVIDLDEKARDLKQVSTDDSARASDIEHRLTMFRRARAVAEKQLTEDLTKARVELTELLTAKQELTCVMNGLLE